MPFRPAALVAALALAFSTGFAEAADPSSMVTPGASTGAGPLAAGLDKAGMDTAVRPQDDLFDAMNGNWMKATEIPPDKPEYGTFIVLRDESDRHLREIIEALSSRPQEPGTNDAKIADYYNAYLDTDAIDKAGLAPVRPFLATIDAMKDKRALVALMGRWQGLVDQPVQLQVQPDSKDPTIYVPFADQSGLGLPDRDYYLKDTERFSKARAAYLTYMQTLLSLSGDKQAPAHAAAVMELEHRIAEAQWSKEDNRDPIKTYNPMTVQELEAKAPGVDWKQFLRAAEMPVPSFVAVNQPTYLAALGKIVEATSVDTWKAYLRVRVLGDAANVLPKPFRDARFAFRGQALTGAKEDRPRWQKAVAALDAAMGEAVGQAYVSRYFPPEYKARMVQLVNNLLEAYSTSIDGLAWMTPATKKAAHEKLAKYTVKIGYPDKWRDYSALVIKPHDALGNNMRAAKFEYMRQVVRVGKKVDRTEWLMTPQTVNAYYDPTKNEIVFPAAILQPPFFDMKADDAANYGAIGAVIGHEISHGFDDEGSKFDGDGALRDWWTDADRKAFEELTNRLVAQFDSYEPIKGTHVNGKLTLGENIADLSGLQIAYKAYKIALAGKPAPVIDGMTGDQRFYFGWAQAWREKTRDERMLQLVTADPHSPSQSRANGAAVNADGFQEAFGTKPGDAMYKAPADRIRIW